MNFEIRLGTWTELRAFAQSIRHKVFIVEQNVPVELEWDDMDAICVHAVAFDASGQAVGTGRLLPDGHIGRMAVLPAARGTGVGSTILLALMRQAEQRGDQSVLLNAQTYAQAFYRKHGFVAYGDEFMDAGIPHVQMRYSFS